MELVEKPKASKANKAEPTFKKLTVKQQVGIIDILRLHCHTRADGTCYYDQGWNDLRIQEEGAPDYKSLAINNPASATSRLRKELFGDLREASTATNTVERLEACEKKILRLEFLLSWALKELGMNPPDPIPVQEPTAFDAETAL